MRAAVRTKVSPGAEGVPGVPGAQVAKAAPTAADIQPLPPLPADLAASLAGAREREETPRAPATQVLARPPERGLEKVRAVAISIPPDPADPPKIRASFGSIRPAGAASLVGSVVGGRYTIERLLGEGAMGAVFLAEHRLMRKKVALKVLHPQWSSVPDIVARFEREAMAASRIEHPNVAAATDFGQLEDGSFFLVLEFVEGRTLREELQAGAFHVPRALQVVRQMVSALVKAHGLGIVHRDLKPENVMLIERGGHADFVKVLDFGIAKITEGELDRKSGPKTEVGMVYGTPEYMAPEQAMGQSVDGRADLYAIGVIAYELLTGTRPFHAENKLALLGMHVHADVPAMSDKNPVAGVPPMVERLVLRLLAKKPTDRVADARALINDLDDLAHELLNLGLYADDDIKAIGSMRELRSPRGIDISSGRAVENLAYAPTDLVPSNTVPATQLLPRVTKVAAAHEEVIDLEPRKSRARPALVAAIAALFGAAMTVAALALVRGGGAHPGPVAPPPDAAVAVVAAIPAAPPAPAPYAPEKTLPAPSVPGASAAGTLLQPSPSAVWPPVPAVAPVLTAATVSPEQALREAQEFTLAGKYARAVSVLEDALASHPKHPALSLALFKAQRGSSSRAQALTSASKWLESDPSAVPNAAPQLLAMVDDAIASNDGIDEALRLLEDRLGARGADKLYDLAYGPGAKTSPSIAARARTGLQFASAVTKATPALRITMQMRQAHGCEEASALMKRAREVADERIIPVLRAYEKTDGCRGTDCYACLRSGSDLADAIRSAEKRAYPSIR